MQELTTLLQQAESAISTAHDLPSLEQIKIDFLGKKGKLTEVLKSLGSLPPEQRPLLGQAVNEAKQQVQTLLETRTATLEQQELARQLATEQIDVTLPGRESWRGQHHPVSLAKQRIIDYFVQLGFEIVEGPEVETDYYNFTALNIPEHHPAKAMHDTFYFADGRLLRTHTSPVQVRSMETRKPPLRLIAPGRVYRCDSDMTHTPMFHQVEMLYVDEGATMAGLKSLLKDFFEFYFERDLKLRFRPSHFPFTEPSAEVDISCTNCNGKGCRSCKNSGWLEVLGCGMVHPKLLASVGIDSEKYTGWAFGMGIDRMAMLRYQIDDLRILFENDLRFLKQF